MAESKPIVLRSTANPTVRHLVRMRDNGARRKAGRVLVDGWRETALAIEAGLKPCGIYLPESLLEGGVKAGSEQELAIRRVLDYCSTGATGTWVSEPVMQKICYGQSNRGVVGEFERPQRRLDQLALQAAPLILVLDRIEKPGNLGAVFRCADAAGVDAVLLCESSDPYNPNAIRSSLGSVFHVPLVEAAQDELQEFLEQRSIRVLSARVESSTPLWSVDLAGPLAIVLGSEAAGLGDRWRTLGRRDVAGIRIPMSGRVDSLNIAVSAAVLAFEAIRQRRAVPTA
jgi:TrmH family RNA methyltransferase